MPAEILTTLFGTNLALAIAVAAVLALRGPFRTMFGSRAAYLL